VQASGGHMKSAWDSRARTVFCIPQLMQDLENATAVHNGLVERKATPAAACGRGMLRAETDREPAKIRRLPAARECYSRKNEDVMPMPDRTEAAAHSGSELDVVMSLPFSRTVLSNRDLRPQKCPHCAKSRGRL